MRYYWVKDTDRKIIASSLTLVIFAGVWAVCGRPQPRLRVNDYDATAVIFS